MKKQIRMNLKEQTDFVKLLNEMAYEHSAYDVFCDFLTMSCYSIANAVHYKKERESKYLEIIGKYKKNVQEGFPRLLGLVCLGLERKFCDFLGEIYMDCGFGDDRSGQFFTPYPVALVCAESIVEKVKDNKIFTVLEPSCGSGEMVIALADVLHKKRIRLSTLFVRSSSRFVLELGLHGVHSVVFVGDSCDGGALQFTHIGDFRGLRNSHGRSDTHERKACVAEETIGRGRKMRRRKISLNKVQEAFNAAIRRRDGRCVIRDYEPCCGDLECSHFYTVGSSPSLRFYPPNAYAQCQRHHWNHHNKKESAKVYEDFLLDNHFDDRMKMICIRSKYIWYTDELKAEIIRLCDSDKLDELQSLIENSLR